MSEYTWKVVEWGYTAGPGGLAKELFKGDPTEKELQDAQIVVVEYTNVDDKRDTRYFTIRVPFGFGGLQPTALDDLALYIQEQAERYNFELVDHAP